MATPRPVRQRPLLVVLLLALAAAAYLVFPVVALATRVPWNRLGGILRRDEVTQLLGLTLSASVLTTIIVVLIGVPLALALQSLTRGRHLARLLVLLPLAMPPVVGGLALSALLGNNGLTSTLLDTLGLQFAFAFPGVVAAHVFVALPFVVVTVDSALRQLDPEVTASAAGVGMSPRRVLYRITLPTIRPAIATGAGLAFARSLGEFGTTITFAGSMPGITRTLSLAIYLERETDREAAYALSVLLIVLAVIVLSLASLPELLRKAPQPVARTLAPMDTTRLRTLTAPHSPATVIVRADGITTEFPAGTITAVVGPNGSGKSTFTGMIAGRLTGASVAVEGDSVDRQPAFRRGIVLLTQTPGLPHTGTVTDIISMVTGHRARTDELLDAAGLAPLSNVPIADLSGGQAAQIALLRALASRPRALILDEPLASVDVTSSARWRALLRATARDRTTLLVTHDLLDIAGLSDRILAMDGGVPAAAGATADLLQRPPTEFVAGLTGVNRITGTVAACDADTVTINDSGLTVVSRRPPDTDIRAGESAVATFLPEAVSIEKSPPAETSRTVSARNRWAGTVSDIQVSTTSAATVVVSVGTRILRADVTTASVVNLGLEPGSEVVLIVKAQAIAAFPLNSREGNQ